MASDLTKQLERQWRDARDRAYDAMTEVLCSAYKDATGSYPSDRLREKLYDAIRYEC